MCGICGFTWGDGKLVKSMADVIEHRGPDDDGYFVDGRISLGNRRLSIIDLSKKGKQPCRNETGSVNVVYNGEIYNFLSLRKDLERRGHRFYSNTDTEVIAHAYEEHGFDCVKKFNGMFAFALWDSDKKRLFIARDPLGIKPLYYHLGGGNLVFGSEIKAILENPAVEKKLDLNGLAQVVRNLFATDSRTLFEGIRELPPAHYLVFSKGKCATKRYWSIEGDAARKSLSEDYFASEIRRVLSASVKSMLVSDVPVGATLSGGIDSSTIVALMSEALEDGKVRTFTAGFEGEENEFKYARLVAEKCGTEHREISIPLEGISKAIPELVWHLESVPVRTAVFPTFFFSKEIRKRVKVILIGEGGDELFGGYEREAPFAFKSFGAEARQNPQRFLSESFFRRDKKVFSEKFRRILESRGGEAAVINSYLKGATRENALNRALAYEIEKQLPGVQLLRIDKLTMASSVEARVPYLDLRMVGLSARIPSRLKIANGNEKYVLKKAASEILPKEIWTRKKLGLASPLDSWFEKEFSALVPQILSEKNLSGNDVFRAEGTRELLKKRRLWRVLSSVFSKPIEIASGRGEATVKNRYLGQIWFLSMLALFLRVYFDSEKTAKPKPLDYYLS